MSLYVSGRTYREKKEEKSMHKMENVKEKEEKKNSIALSLFNHDK